MGWYSRSNVGDPYGEREGRDREAASSGIELGPASPDRRREGETVPGQR
jgi:hypothetical protein